MRPTFLQLSEDQRRLVQQCADLHEEIRGETMKAIAVIDCLTEILDEDQRRREKERQTNQ